LGRGRGAADREGQARRAAAMSALFGKASVRLGARLDAGRAVDARALLEKLGRAALAANSDWVRLDSG
jgi:hypothetical protein